MEIYEAFGLIKRIEARLIELEKRAGELEHKLEALEALAKQVTDLERKLERIRDWIG